MEVNTGEIKRKVYRRTERRAESCFQETHACTVYGSNIIRCNYCNNGFFGVDRQTALQHLYNHIRRKHSERAGSVTAA